jgi:fatty acid desaturase
VRWAAGLLAAAWTGFVLIGDSWWQLAVAGFLAFVFTQIGFLGHDAGHRQIFRSKRANYLVGLLHGNLAIGLSYGWWVDKHNRHHAHPNTEDKDPDIDIGALAFTAGQARAKRSRVTRFIARHQRYLSSRCCCWKRYNCMCPASRRSPVAACATGSGRC